MANSDRSSALRVSCGQWPGERSAAYNPPTAIADSTASTHEDFLIDRSFGRIRGDAAADPRGRVKQNKNYRGVLTRTLGTASICDGEVSLG